MNDNVKILIVEDLLSDAELAIWEIKQVLKNFTTKIVQTETEFLNALQEFQPDIIITDYKLPTFDGLTALKLSLQFNPLTPVIILTGSQNEDTAVECMKAGATDYVIKEHIKRLGLALFNALESKKLKEQKAQAETKLRESEERFRRLAENAQDLIYRYEFFPKRGFTYVSPSATHITGFTPEEHYADPDLGFKLVHPEDRHLLERLTQDSELIQKPLVLRWIKKDGTIIWTEQRNVPIYDNSGNLIAIEGIARDITDRKQSEIALRESEELFRSLADSTASAIFIYQGNKFVYVNRATVEMTGYSSEELLAVNFWDVVHPDFKEMIKTRGLARQAGEAVPNRYEFKVIRKDGSVIWIDFTAGYISWKGKPAAIGSAFDITSRKAIEEALKKNEEQFRLIWENSSDGMRLTDENGRIILVNDAFCKMFEITKEQIEGNFISSLYLDIDKQRILYKHIERFRSRMVKERFETHVFLHNGKAVWFDVSNSFIEIGGKTLLLGIFRDITEQKRLIKELTEAKEKAVEANRLKSGFLSSMSHEIRTPLNVILGFGEIIKDLVDLEKYPEYEPYFVSLENSGLRLITTVTQILDMSRLETNEFPISLKPLSINSYVKRTVEDFRRIAFLKGLKLNVELCIQNPKVIADEYCLTNVLYNLLSNAIKFSDKGTIEVKTVPHVDSIMCIIRDQGIGMGTEYQKHLYEPFSQEIVGFNRPYEGTGLGLALTKRYLDLMGGQIRIKSQKDVGTTVEFFLKTAEQS